MTDPCMSNFDHRIDEGFAEAMQVGGRGYHYAWDFCGEVWWENGKFCEEVWVNHVLQEVISADTLRALMKTVNNKYGWD